MTQDILWKAVEQRDTARAGDFVYAVVSTGIYCRATCPSRRPERRNVQFYDSPQQAESAGFRACLRCRPNETGAEDSILRRAAALVDASGGESFSLEDLAARASSTPRQLQRLFRDKLGVTPRQYAAAARLDVLKAKLRQGVAVTGALYDAGYGSSSRLYESAGARMGMTPAAYRKRGAGLEIGWDIAGTTLGSMLLASTARGLCALYFGESDSALEVGLLSEYPAASLKREPQPLMQTLAAALAEARPLPQVPLDVQATAFQARVWEELRRIPFGATATYSDVASRIGKAPSRARRCHRVRQQSGRSVDTLPPCVAQGRRAWRISLGSRPEKAAPRVGITLRLIPA